MTTPSTISRQRLPLTVWSLIEEEADRKRKEGGSVIAVQIGDTFLPLLSLLTEPIPGEEEFFSTLNRYSDTFGELPLREKLLEKVREKNRLPADGVGCIQVTAGATGGLFSAMTQLINPGGEVLTLAPYWSILRQVAEAARVKLVEVPFYDKLAEEPEISPLSLIEPYLTSRSSALYLNNPSNPTGMVLNRDQLSQILEWAIRKDLWIFADEAYEDFIWEGESHIAIGSLLGGWDRTVSVFTFSKSLGISGFRVGYVVAPEWVISRINRAVVGSTYQTSRIAQLYAYRGLMRLDQAVTILRQAYQPTFQWVRENLELPHLPVKGGFYFFVKLGEDWRGLSSEEQILKMLENGVALAPGEYFGKAYGEWARLCFTVLPSEEIKTCINRLNQFTKGEDKRKGG